MRPGDQGLQVKFHGFQSKEVFSPRSASPSRGLVEARPRKRHRVIVAALEDVASGIAVLGIVGAASFALARLQKGAADQTREDCGACSGTGLCPQCSGQGFVMKELLPDVAAKAKKSANAAKRNTAGLPNKWKYCVACSGSRTCLECQGRGWNLRSS
ncbi:uncharacterized protein LOC9644315 [Selaginella moellendorffii]|nr:uncharacterized protein LOC9644315 [Selaginella moellendorffii]|eukprot:XP_002983999.2 uncharacterized protein LOC9644315 [Selaginella moellendorffii]